MQTDIKSSDGALEEPKDAGKGEEGEIKRWIMELDLSTKNERDWTLNAKDAIKRYRNEKKRGDDGKTRDSWQYNIFWSNIDVLRPHLYGNTPKADVRRRYLDADPVGKVAAEVLERALDYTIDTCGFDKVMNDVVLDYLIPSRGVARIRFEPTTEVQKDEQGNPIMNGETPMEAMTFAKVYPERVAWDRFRRGPGITWNEVPWVAYEHQLTKQDIADKFKKSFLVDYDITMEGVSDEKAATEPNVFKRTRVWEIWDKENAEILWLAPSLKSQFLLREEDKLKLEGFFDCEDPLYAVESGSSLVPIVEYDMYRSQAKELDNVTLRINKLISTLKQRGIYDSTIKEFSKVFTAGDNDLIPTDSANLAMQAGGLDKAIWLMPIETAAKVLEYLYAQREQIKQTIYELTGISDVLRGSSDPNETLGAQQLKAQTGSMRIQRRQRDVQRFIRGLLRKMAEVIGENYTPELLSMMTGVQLPTGEEKIMAQQFAQQFSSQQQPVPPEVQQTLQSPSWDEVMKVLKSDLLRSFRVDIETDSTIAADQAAERQQVTEMITGIGAFIQSVGPAVETGALSMETVKKMLVAAVRRFKFGREVEDAIEQDSAKPQEQKPDPEAQKAQAQLQLEQAKGQIAAQLEDKKHQNNLQLETMKTQNAAQLAQSQQSSQAQQDTIAQREETARKGQEMQLQHEADIRQMLATHKLDMEQLSAQTQAKLVEIAAQAQADLQMKREELAMQAQSDAHARQQEHGLALHQMDAAKQADMEKAKQAADLAPEKGTT